MVPGASGGRRAFLVGHESAEVTFLKPQGEPGDHSMARRARPCPPVSWRRLKGGMGTGGEQTHRSLVGTLRVSLWQELVSVRGTEKLTAFGENQPGPQRQWGYHAGRHIPAKNRGVQRQCLEHRIAL